VKHPSVPLTDKLTQTCTPHIKTKFKVETKEGFRVYRLKQRNFVKKWS